jgi:hypothetical protein
LAEKLERGLHPSDGRDLSMELDKIDGEHAIEAKQLSCQVVKISDVLVKLVQIAHPVPEVSSGCLAAPQNNYKICFNMYIHLYIYYDNGKLVTLNT